MRTADLFVRVLMKETRETYHVACSKDGFTLAWKTGHVDANAGVEYNDRGEVVRQWPVHRLYGRIGT